MFWYRFKYLETNNCIISTRVNSTNSFLDSEHIKPKEVPRLEIVSEKFWSTNTDLTWLCEKVSLLDDFQWALDVFLFSFLLLLFLCFSHFLDTYFDVYGTFSLFSFFYSLVSMRCFTILLSIVIFQIVIFNSVFYSLNKCQLAQWAT